MIISDHFVLLSTAKIRCHTLLDRYFQKHYHKKRSNVNQFFALDGLTLL